jgi:cell division protein FtsN
MQEHLQPVSVQQGGGLYKVWVGPYRDAADIELTTARLIELGYERPHKVKP